MRDSIGGTVILVIIMFFMVFAIAYLAYNVNYQKAFRMKNKIVSIYEKYNGNCNASCISEINAYADEIGYDTEKNFPCNDIKGQEFNPKTSTGGSFVSGDKQLYCVKGVQQKTKLGEDSGVYDDTGKRGCYYQIVTKINIRIPIIENIVGTPALYVTGDTKVFNKSNEDCVIKNE